MNKKVSLLKASVIVTLIAIFGKFFGFARDAVIAAYYGANWQTDAFFFAQTMPAMLFPALGNSLSTAFVTMYISRTIDKGEKKGEAFASRILLVTLIISVILSILGIIFAPYIVPIFAPGFSEIQAELAVDLTRLTMSAFTLTMASYMFAAILNSKKLFYGSQVAAIGYNLTVIIITLGLGDNQDVQLLTISVILGHFIQVIILIVLLRKRFSFTPKLSPIHTDSKSFLKLAFPILLGNSIVQVNNIIDRALASLLENGAVSALSYSNSLNRLVTGVLITTLSTVVYPSLTTSLSDNNKKKFHHDLQGSLTLIPLIVLPISLLTIIYATEIVEIVYERGNFDSSSTKLTSTALAFYAGMYFFMSIQEIVTRAFYALKNSKTPMINAAIAVALNSVLSIYLAKLMGIGGIALGTTLSTFLASLILLLSLKKELPELNLKPMLKTFLKMSFASIFMVISLVFLKNYLDIYPSLVQFTVATLIGIAIYFISLIIMKTQEVTVLLDNIIKKIRKNKL